MLKEHLKRITDLINEYERQKQFVNMYEEKVNSLGLQTDIQALHRHKTIMGDVRRRLRDYLRRNESEVYELNHNNPKDFNISWLLLRHAGNIIGGLVV